MAIRKNTNNRITVHMKEHIQLQTEQHKSYPNIGGKSRVLRKG